MLDSELNNNGDETSPVANGATGPTDPVVEESPPVPAAVPAVLFQAPQVLFQPPQSASPGRGAGGAGVGSSGTSGNGAGTAEAADEEAGPGSGRGTGRRPAGRGTRGRTTRDRDRDREATEADAAEPEDDDAAADLAGPAGQTAADAGAGEDDAEEAAGPRRRRRSRDRRSRSRVDADFNVVDPGVTADLDEGADAEADDDGEDDTATGLSDGMSTSRRRRRKRRRGTSDSADVSAPDDPPDTVVHVREPHNLADDVRSVKGSTRLEAKKQRRREGRESGRRRPPVVTESEFLARRESVERTMVVRQRGDRTQIAVLEDGVLVEHYVNRTTHQSYVGNVYLGKVQNVLPSMEAAFVDIGKGRNAVLYAGEVNFDASGLEGQPKRIESALKPGQSVIVQVTKDPVGHKGARLTSQVSLPGRYLVYVPGASMTGISRKLPDTERNRLKHILKKVTPENAGVIVRTAAEGAAEAELERDVTRLAAQWESIEKKAKTATAPALLYGEPDLTIRVVRDVFNEDFSQLVVSGDDGWGVIDEYVSYVAPHLAERLERWGPEASSGGSAAGGDDVFAAYRIDEQLAKAMERKVWLPSGGSLIIDRTEAMTVVDVNTGKFTGQGGNLEETVTRNNLESAEEIVRQLRLRDIGGIIVIDFIDMVLESNRELVLRRLLECLARDRTKHQVAEVTSLGLVQMTRKRVGAGLLEAFSEPCECCNGRGVIVHLEQAESNGHHAPRRGGGNSGSGGRGGNGTEQATRDGSGGADPASGHGGSASPDATSDPGAPGGDSGRPSGRRNRRDRDSRRHGGSTAVAQAIAGVASATLAVSPDSGVLSVDTPALEEAVPASFSPAGVTEAPATETEPPPAGPASTGPVADVPPAAPGRRTRAGSAMVRRVITTSDEPVAVVVTAPAAPEAAPADREPGTEEPAPQAATATEVSPVTDAAAPDVAEQEPEVEPAVAEQAPEPASEAEPAVAAEAEAAEAFTPAEVSAPAESALTAEAGAAEPADEATIEPVPAPVEDAAAPETETAQAAPEAAEASGPAEDPEAAAAQAPAEDLAPAEAVEAEAPAAPEAEAAVAPEAEAPAAPEAEMAAAPAPEAPAAPEGEVPAEAVQAPEDVAPPAEGTGFLFES